MNSVQIGDVSLVGDRLVSAAPQMGAIRKDGVMVQAVVGYMLQVKGGNERLVLSIVNNGRKSALVVYSSGIDQPNNARRRLNPGQDMGVSLDLQRHKIEGETTKTFYAAMYTLVINGMDVEIEEI